MALLDHILFGDGVVGILLRAASLAVFGLAVLAAIRMQHDVVVQKTEIIWLLASLQATHGIIFSWACEGRFEYELFFPVVEPAMLAYLLAAAFCFIILVVQLVQTRSMIIEAKLCTFRVLCAVASVLLLTYTITYAMHLNKM